MYIDLSTLCPFRVVLQNDHIFTKSADGDFLVVHFEAILKIKIGRP